jgi:hypothetical protein
MGWIRVAFGPVAALVAIATAAGLNGQGTLDWGYDASTKDAVREMVDVSHTKRCKRLRAVCHWVYAPAVEFYLSRSSLEIVNSQRDGDFVTFDLAKDRELAGEDGPFTEVYYVRRADMNRLDDALLVHRQFQFSGSIVAEVIPLLPGALRTPNR